MLLMGVLFAGAAVWLTTSAEASHWVWKGWERLFGPTSLTNVSPRIFAQTGGSPNYTITTIDEPSAGTSATEGTIVFAVNASGAITGAYSDQAGVAHGFVDANGTFTSFDAFNETGLSPKSGWFQGTTGISIDSSGDVAGTYADSNNAYHGFVRSAAGTITTFDDPNAPTATSSRGTFPMSINDAGQIVGFYTTGNYATTSLYRGFLYSVAGNAFTELDEPNAGTGNSAYYQKQGTVPTAINGSGTVAGYYIDSGGSSHGFVYAAGSYTSFDVPGAATNTAKGGGLSGTVPMSIDTAGDVAGTYTDSSFVRHGFIRSAGGKITTFNAPGANTTSQSGMLGGTFPTHIDPTGSYITGIYTDSSGLGHGFVYYLPLTSSSSFTTFTPPNMTTSTTLPIQGGVFSVNGSGTVVGFYLDSGVVAHGFVYTTNAIPTPAPTFNPPQGTYGSTQTVSISDANPAATIYYTTDGSTPTTGSNVYTGPITVSSTETIEAIAAASGYAASSVATATYALNLSGSTPAPAPQFSPGGGTYSAAQTVAIADSASGASIYYTLDGTVPTGASALYTGPVTISTSAELQAIAIAPDYAPSIIAAASYQISGTNLPQFVYNVAGTEQPGYNGDGVPATQADLGGIGYATAMDSSGNLYIADTGNNRIRMVSASTGLISTFAGTGTSGYSGDGGSPTAAQLSSPSGLAVDSSDNVYIADTGNGLVRVVTKSTGLIGTYAGVVNSGVPQHVCSATANGFGLPRGIAFDRSGNLYVTDLSCSVAWKVTAGTKAVSVFAGELYSCEYNGDGVPATSATLCEPFSVALDPSGNVYIADFGNARVREVLTGSGNVITTVAGNGSFTVSGDGGPATAAGIGSPWAIAVDSSSNLYIGGLSSLSIRVVSGGIISTFAGELGNSSVNNDGAVPLENAVWATSLSFGPTGALYFFDVWGNRLQMVSAPAAAPSTSAATPVISLNSGTYSSPQTVTLSDTTPGATIYFTLDGSTPTGTSSLYHGSVVVTGSSTLTAIAIAPGYVASAPASADYAITPAPSTVISTIATSDTTVGVPNEGCFGGIALDHANDVYAIDSCSSYTAVFEISAATGNASPVAGNGVYGYAGDGGQAVDAEFRFGQYSGVALDAAGNIYLADTNNNRVRMINAQTGVISTFAGTGTSGYSGDGGAATSANLSQPMGLAFDAQGNLYIADEGNDIIRMVGAQTGNISTVAGTPQHSGYSGDNGPATSAYLSSPEGVALDPSGNLYIGDEGNSRIRKVTQSTGNITTIAGNGNYGATGDGGPALNAQITPAFLLADAQGNVYFTNVGTGVREIAAASGTISTVVGDGYRGTWGDGGPPTNAGLNIPTGIASDSNGDLFVADWQNQNIRAVTAAVATPTFSPAAGSYTGAQTVTINDATIGAKIYYTTNGETPTTGSTLYSAPVTVSSSETLQAIAVSGYATSAVGYAAYSINALVAAIPTFSPAAGTYNSAQSVTIYDATTGATIYYTTNGTAPTTGSAVYTGPITVSSSETIQAIATASGYATSGVGSATYTITFAAATPTFSPAAGTYTSAQTVTINDATTGATIYYTTNGTAPTTGSALYTGPITVSSPETIQAIATASGYATSGVGSATYTITSPAATPTFSPGPGTYTSPQAVRISDATSGATIYYTTNGTTPTTGSAVYTGPITVSSSETIEAIAAASGHSTSNVAIAVYVIKIASETTLTSSSTSVSYGQPLVLSATVRTARGIPPNGETVQFFSGKELLGTGALRGGNASLTITTLPAGAYSITAAYPGDGGINGSTSPPVSITVRQATTRLILVASAGPWVFGVPVTFTATVTYAGGVPPNGETITFERGRVTLGTANLNNGKASLTLSNLPVGTDSITAIYNGDANLLGSQNAISIKVVPAPEVTLGCSLPANPGNSSNPVSWTVMMTNKGPGTAYNLRLTTATLNGVGGKVTPSANVGSLNQGGSRTLTITGGLLYTAPNIENVEINQISWEGGTASCDLNFLFQAGP